LVSLVAVVVMALFVVPGSAGASPYWTISPSPNPTGATSTGLGGVWCVNTTWCDAAGTFMTGTTWKPLVEHWNGARWLLQVPPVPSGAMFSALNGIGCVTTANCWAVGHAGSGSAPRMLFEHWNGAKWLLVPGPVVSGATASNLFGVWCVNGSSCDAVGDYQVGSSEKPLDLHWAGIKWKQVIMSAPTGAQITIPKAITCLAVTNCWAVGQYFAGGMQRDLVEHWNGTSWKLGSAPAPTGATATMFNAARCLGGTNCWAVGAYNTVSGQWDLVEHWNGTKWSVVNTPWVTGANSALYGIACPSATNCNAVGAAAFPTMQNTLVMHWNGSKWARVNSPNATGMTFNVLFAIACPGFANCFAVGTASKGTTQSRALIEKEL
jgi:hypothetical protein